MKADYPIGYFIGIDDIPKEIVKQHPQLKKLHEAMDENNERMSDIGWVDLEVEGLDEYKSFTKWLMEQGFTYKDNFVIEY